MEIDPNLPINKTSAIVVSKTTEVYRQFKNGGVISSMTPLPTQMFCGPKKDDLTGKTTGKFTVVGCSLWKPQGTGSLKNHTRWVVRCACGRYQILTTRAVKNNHPNTACVECRQISYLRKSVAILLLLIPLCANSQTVQLPSWVVDSLIYEATLSRHCDSLQRSQQKEIETLGLELIANQNAVRMQTRQLVNADSLIGGLKKEIILVQERGDIRLKEERKKSRRFKIAAALEGLLILILII